MSGIASQSGVTSVDYLLTQGTVILRYLRQLVLPWGFSVDPDIKISTGLLA